MTKDNCHMPACTLPLLRDLSSLTPMACKSTKLGGCSVRASLGIEAVRGPGTRITCQK